MLKSYRDNAKLSSDSFNLWILKLKKNKLVELNTYASHVLIQWSHNITICKESVF